MRRHGDRDAGDDPSGNGDQRIEELGEHEAHDEGRAKADDQFMQLHSSRLVVDLSSAAELESRFEQPSAYVIDH